MYSIRRLLRHFLDVLFMESDGDENRVNLTDVLLHLESRGGWVEVLGGGWNRLTTFKSPKNDV